MAVALMGALTAAEQRRDRGVDAAGDRGTGCAQSRAPTSQPARVTGTDSFHVIEGEADLEPPTPRRSSLSPGHLRVPGRVHRHLADPLAVLEVLRDRLTTQSVHALHSID
jgi:hypothetical protein